MNNKENILYGIGIIVIIISCVLFFYSYVYPKFPESLEVPISYLDGYYRDLDSMAIYNGQADRIACFEYTLPQTYNFGYDLIMANRYRDTNSSYYFFEKLVSLTKDKIWNYETDIHLNHALEKMDDSLRIIALRHLSHSPLFYGKNIEDSIRIGKYATLYDSIYIQEHKAMKGLDDE